jgi:hypothetical protein
MNLEKEFVPYQIALDMKSIGFDEYCFGYYDKIQIFHLCPFGNMNDRGFVSAPTFSQAARYLYINSNKQINFQIDGKDSYKELCEKLKKAIQDFRDLQNSES